MGTADLTGTQPGGPCYKMNVAFDGSDRIERFLHAERSGLYLGVVREGESGSGDSIELLFRPQGSPTIADLAAAKET